MDKYNITTTDMKGECFIYILGPKVSKGKSVTRIICWNIRSEENGIGRSCFTM